MRLMMYICHHLFSLYDRQIEKKRENKTNKQILWQLELTDVRLDVVRM